MALGCGSAERESSKGVEFYAPPRANSFAIQRGARSRGYPRPPIIVVAVQDYFSHADLFF
jgi:hypothetical protein